MHSSRIELSRSALHGNIAYLRGLFGDDVTFCSVVKGNAYGHGIETMVPLVEEAGVRQFAVFSADEAARVLESRRQDSDVMIMGVISDEALDWAVEGGLSFYVFDLERLEAAVEAARRVGRPARIHLELETGMHRTGLQDDALPEAAERIRRAGRHVALEGVCTHLAGAEASVNHPRVRRQITLFHRLRTSLAQRGLRPRRTHMACLAAALTFPETRLDMVRVGIAQYGFWPSPETRMRVLGEADPDSDPLRRVVSWKSRIMTIAPVDQGDYIGYGTTYLAGRPMRVAVVPVGYGYGFARRLSNVGRVLVRGQRTGVVGLVNMNMICIDVTDVAGVARGDEVVLIGEQGGLRVTVASFAELSNSLNYELLTRLPLDIPRRVVP